MPVYSESFEIVSRVEGDDTRAHLKPFLSVNSACRDPSAATLLKKTSGGRMTRLHPAKGPNKLLSFAVSHRIIYVVQVHHSLQRLNHDDDRLLVA